MTPKLIRCALVLLLCVGMTGCATVQQELEDIQSGFKSLKKADGTLDWDRIGRGLEAVGDELGNKRHHKSVVYPPSYNSDSYCARLKCAIKRGEKSKSDWSGCGSWSSHYGC